jgi:hypothetical protein
LREKLTALLSDHPEYKEFLVKAVNHEERHRTLPSYLGWTWYDVEAHPAKLVRLVTEGIARVSAKTRSYTLYLLKDRHAVKEVLYERLVEQSQSR